MQFNDMDVSRVFDLRSMAGIGGEIDPRGRVVLSASLARPDSGYHIRNLDGWAQHHI
jgi:hypothetical protein